MNGYPTLQLVLNPGGCAGFLFPVSGGQQNFFLTPGRKDGDVSLKSIFASDVYIAILVQTVEFNIASNVFCLMSQNKNCIQYFSMLCAKVEIACDRVNLQINVSWDVSQY